MITLTRLDGRSVAVVLEAIKYVEAIPDTLIFFLNGESLLVRESLDDILKAVEMFKARVVVRSRQFENSLAQESWVDQPQE